MMRFWVHLAGGCIVLCCLLCVVGIGVGRWLTGGRAQLAYTGGAPRFALYLVDVERQLRVTLLADFADSPSHLHWSPDGSRLLFDVYQARVKQPVMLDVPSLRLSAAPRPLSTQPSAQRAAWSSDGRWQAFVAARGNLPYVFVQSKLPAAPPYVLSVAGVYEVAWRPTNQD